MCRSSAASILVAILLLASGLALFSTRAEVASPTILGKWKTFDDETGEPDGIVEIFERDGKLHGKIASVFPRPGDPPELVCDACKKDDPRYKQKIIGMEVIQDMERHGEEWKNGTILDPENGKVYDCKMWLEEGRLKVRGYLLFLYRTQEWLPIERAP